MSQFFGFELLLNSVRADLKEKHELIAVVFHWFLIRENFQCIGTGTEVSLRILVVSIQYIITLSFLQYV